MYIYIYIFIYIYIYMNPLYMYIPYVFIYFYIGCTSARSDESTFWRLFQVEPNRPRYRGVGLDGSFPVEQGSELQCATHHPGGAAHESSTSGYFHPGILHPGGWVTT